MGFGGISLWQLLIILAIVLLLFGTKRLRNIGSDLGGAFKGFKKAISDEDKSADKTKQAEPPKITGEETVKHENTQEKTKQG
jgi:sec-independent protein translocase protein TatA